MAARAKRIGIWIGALLLGLGVAACTQHLRLSGGDAAPIARPPGTLRIATLNVHYIDLRAAGGPWSLAGWEDRRDALDAAFKSLDADAVAFQEMESFAGGAVSRDNLALDWLLARNPDYAAAAIGDPMQVPSTQPILYRPSRLELRDQGWFFFAETPERLYARGFDGASPSFASWATFRDRREARDVTIYNVHFDYGSWENRRRSADLAADRIGASIRAGQQVVLAGDLNARQGSPTMEILEMAGLSFRPVPGATYHLNRGLNLFGAIDHLGFGPGLRPVGAVGVARQRWAGAWPSDHYPVFADFAFE